jgi:hypothetical protein
MQIASARLGFTLIGEPDRVRRERSIMTRGRLGKLASAIMLVLVCPTLAIAQQPPPGVQVGMLRCNLAPSIGLIVAESQRMSCRFAPNGPYPPQNYNGVMNTVGLELGVTAGGVMAWRVFAPTGGTPIGALAGEYVGASGDISVGVGVGGNVLFGGSNRTIALQPLSVEGDVGVGVSLGVSGLTLALAP